MNRRSLLNVSEILLILLILIGLVSCTEKKEDDVVKAPYRSIQEVPETEWEILGNKRIYFGHQSVGYNLIQGVHDVMSQYPQIKLNIIETKDLSQMKGGYFAHSQIGENKKPDSKINEFIEVMEKNSGNPVDIAFFKFCYVDIHNRTELESVFQLYKNRMGSLINKFPKTQFIHFTVPLTLKQHEPDGWLVKVKKTVNWILKKPDVFDNSFKYEYNDKVRSFYENKNTLFDFAYVESTYPDGRKNIFEKNGKKIEALITEYTDDGGHLNSVGRYHAAESLLLYLVNMNRY